MKKNVFGRKFKRDVNERKALFKSLLSELVMHGRIKTTEQKAKSIKSTAEKLVTRAQKEANTAKRLLSQHLIPQAMEKMIKEIAPQFAQRNGGYTRIIRLGKRFNDDASLVLLEWVEGVGQVVRGAKAEVAPKAPRAAKATEVVEGELVTSAKEKKASKTAEKKAASTSSAQEKKTVSKKKGK